MNSVCVILQWIKSHFCQTLKCHNYQILYCDQGFSHDRQRVMHQQSVLAEALELSVFLSRSLRLTCFVYVKFINCSPSNRQKDDFGFLRAVQAIFVWSLMRRVMFSNVILRLTKDENWCCYCEDRIRITGLRYEQGCLTWFHFCSIAFITSLRLRLVITSSWA